MHNDNLVKLASRASVAVSSILTIAKLYAIYDTNSLSILSSLLDSSFDLAASVTNMIAITIAARPADLTFRFGYGKLEAVSALMQSILMILSVAYLVFESITRLFQPDQEVVHTFTGTVVMAVSVGFTLILITFQHYVIQRTHSIAIRADALHYRTDLLVNIAVLISIYLTQYLGFIDSIMCIVISLYVVISTRHILTESLNVLLDREINQADQTAIKDILTRHPNVRGIHNFRTRTSGNKIFIEAHIEMESTLTLIQSHHIANELKDAVEAAYPAAEVLIHQDPAGNDIGNERLF